MSKYFSWLCFDDGKEFLEFLVTKHHLNPTIVLHDDDSEAIRVMRDTNEKLMEKGFNLKKCACDGMEWNALEKIEVERNGDGRGSGVGWK